MKRSLYILVYICLLTVGAASRSYGQTTCTCNCLKPVFDYLIESNKLFTYTATNQILISKLISDATAAGHTVSASSCDILNDNKTGYFYNLTTATTGTEVKLKFGGCSVSLKSTSGKSIDFLNMIGAACDNSGQVSYIKGPVRVHKRLDVTRSLVISKVTSASPLFPTATTFPAYFVDSTSESLRIGFSSNYGKTGGFNIMSRIAFDSAKAAIPDEAIIVGAHLHVFAYPSGFMPPYYPNAHLPTTACSGSSVFVFSSSTFTYSKDPATLSFPGGWGDGQAIYTTTPSDDASYNMTNFCTNSYGGIYDNSAFDKGMVMFQASWKTIHSPVDTVTQYHTFCSEKYPDPSKRPYLDLVWTTNQLDTVTIAKIYIDTCTVCSTVNSYNCYSAITDTSVNPYRYGIQGNWRPLRSFVYYNARNGAAINSNTNIRTDGTISNFSNFWHFSATDSTWQPQDTATSRWVWNTESTLFNRKGAEMENKDPLGRYNSGLYGYRDALATAVAQNARYREIGYDGFEDYKYVGNSCDSVCSVPRNFDFSAYESYFDSTIQHTGAYSLRLDTGKSAGIVTTISGTDDPDFVLTYNTGTNSCSSSTNVLKGIKAGKETLLPSFSPITGKQLVVSAWVKESGQCDGVTYTGNRINIVVTRSTGDTSILAYPSGNIIEGWQRIEQVVTLPDGASKMTINMQNIGTNKVYFDDLRIHPYNANMKSFVYNAESLRIMAELDENNYATFYEYDDDGTVIRVKKETERGIMTIKEARSALHNE
ncbi:hypothetical protein [Chitinophaga sancti]|uniref:YD repeat-containing protein n=1 Tax=Chitinophaga sancti TaxID=1004 RepID=A0A1K1SSM2_9BACT|nr:hypothetical protein [Chitinophaga sancti]WQD65424.1 hypothetical protein U0033_13570 [Chitinophaga sancti]WQG88953.1 hypothetical protein SR876_28900 [Chitinophaga sancti]SFW87313.1 hypothetical protein SAMN05661012_06046 [Chitinophaga sancti]